MSSRLMRGRPIGVRYRPVVVGVVLIIAALILIPLLVIMSGAVAAAVLGLFLKVDAEASHEGSELIDCNI